MAIFQVYHGPLDNEHNSALHYSLQPNFNNIPALTTVQHNPMKSATIVYITPHLSQARATVWRRCDGEPMRKTATFIPRNNRRLRSVVNINDHFRNGMLIRDRSFLYELTDPNAQQLSNYDRSKFAALFPLGILPTSASCCVLYRHSRCVCMFRAKPGAVVVVRGHCTS